MHALETGLLDETIRAKMRPLLKNDQVADEELIEAMSAAMAAESEWATKFKDEGFLCPVKKRHVTIPKGQTVTVACRANTGATESTRPVLFEPDEKCQWFPRLIVHETLAKVKRGKTAILEIEVTNDTRHDIVSLGRTTLGNLELVRSVAPFPVKLKDNHSMK